ncbi:MAG: WYL domain-containing protein [Oscillospiraceae bacterium]|nr:WYL domain-containing protein [Oscillospiraceae bacterium]
MDNRTSLFAKNKNINYRFASELINYMVCNERGLSKKEADRFDRISRPGINTELLDKNTIFPAESRKGTALPKEYLFTEENGIYSPVIKKQIPPLLTNAERDYLRMLADDPIARCFLSEETIEHLCGRPDIGCDDFIEYRNIRKVPSDFNEEKMRSSIKTLLKAITNGNAVSFGYEGENVTVMPVRLVISARFNTIMLAALPAWSRIILYNVEKIHEIKITDIRADGDIIDTLLSKEIRTVILEIPHSDTVVQTNSVERCLFMFSHLNKSIMYDHSKKSYLIELQYYAFEEEELIRDILSFGSNIVVSEKSPEIRNRVIAEIREILDNMS